MLVTVKNRASITLQGQNTPDHRSRVVEEPFPHEESDVFVGSAHLREKPLLAIGGAPFVSVTFRLVQEQNAQLPVFDHCGVRRLTLSSHSKAKRNL